MELLKKKIWAKFQRIMGSGIRDPGSRIQGSKSTQSRIPDPGSGSATLAAAVLLTEAALCAGVSDSYPSPPVLFYSNLQDASLSLGRLLHNLVKVEPVQSQENGKETTTFSICTYFS